MTDPDVLAALKTLRDIYRYPNGCEGLANPPFDALDAAIERFGACECEAIPGDEDTFCRTCGRRLEAPDADA